MIINTIRLNKELSALRTEKQETATQLVALKLEKDKYEEAKTKYEEEKGKLEKRLADLEDEAKTLKEKLAGVKKEEVAVVTAVA